MIACECSGVVREAFRKLGHNAWSCDLKPAEDGSRYHITGDVLDVLKTARGKWDLMIAHPECRYLSSSGLHRNIGNPERFQKTVDALQFVQRLLAAPIPRIALENPIGAIGTRVRPADQYIQPYEFGEDASKRTGLWLKGLPKLRPTQRVRGRMVTIFNGENALGMRVVRKVERWANQTDSGQNRLGPSETRSADRARTYQGIADAMAEQWGKQ